MLTEISFPLILPKEQAWYLLNLKYRFEQKVYGFYLTHLSLKELDLQVQHLRSGLSGLSIYNSAISTQLHYPQKSLQISNYISILKNIDDIADNIRSSMRDQTFGEHYRKELSDVLQVFNTLPLFNSSGI